MDDQEEIVRKAKLKDLPNNLKFINFPPIEQVEQEIREEISQLDDLQNEVEIALVSVVDTLKQQQREDPEFVCDDSMVMAWLHVHASKYRVTIVC